MSTFKLRPEHQAKIKEHIEAVLSKYPDVHKEYELGNFARADKCKDLQTRLNFDLLYATGLSYWLCTHVYGYCNDQHLANYLRSICPAVTRKY